MHLRKLTMSDVAFTVRAEFDESYSHAEVRGSFATDDDAADDAQAAEIEARVGRGDETAWCGVIVTARWGMHEADDATWGVTLGENETADDYAKENGMFESALHELNRQLERACEPKVVGMVATKYLGPTDSRVSRVKATNVNTGKKAYVPWDPALTEEDNHVAAAWKLMRCPPSHRSSVAGGGYMFAHERRLDSDGEEISYPTEES